MFRVAPLPAVAISHQNEFESGVCVCGAHAHAQLVHHTPPQKHAHVNGYLCVGRPLVVRCAKAPPRFAARRVRRAHVIRADTRLVLVGWSGWG